MAFAVCSSAPLSGAEPLVRAYAGWAEGPFVTSRRFQEAVLRVIVSRSWGNSSLSSRAKRLPAVLARPQSSWGGGLNSVTIS